MFNVFFVDFPKQSSGTRCQVDRELCREEEAGDPGVQVPRW